jgi:hypothetical protein
MTSIIDDADLVEIDNGGPVNAYKLFGVEFVVQIGNGFAQHVPAATDMQATVINYLLLQSCQFSPRIEESPFRRPS